MRINRRKSPCHEMGSKYCLSENGHQLDSEVRILSLSSPSETCLVPSMRRPFTSSASGLGLLLAQPMNADELLVRDESCQAAPLLAGPPLPACRFRQSRHKLGGLAGLVAHQELVCV